MTADQKEKLFWERIGNEGQKIYNKIRSNYEPVHNGKFLAIEVDSKEAYMAEDSIAAVKKAQKVHPDKKFYVVKIGFDAAVTLATPFYYVPHNS